MGYSMSLNNFNKVAAVATFLSAIACLVTAPAEAITQLRFSGSTINGSFISFDIDPSVLNSQSDSNSNLLIENFRFGIVDPLSGPGSSEENSINCQSIFADVTSFNDFTDRGNLHSCVGFKQGNLIREANNSYQATFSKAPDNIILNTFNTSLNVENFILELNIPDTGNGVMNTDIKVTNVPKVEGGRQEYTYNFRDGSQCVESNRTVRPCTIETINTEAVPEPSETTSLLGAGAIGGILLLKRSRRSRKLASSKLTSSKLTLSE
jgi:hypothetical protein